MAENHELQPIWDEIQGHRQKIHGLEMNQAILEKEQESHRMALERMNTEFVRSNAKLESSMDSMSDALRLVTDDFHERQGKRALTKYLLPAFLSFLAIVVTIYVALVGAI